MIPAKLRSKFKDFDYQIEQMIDRDVQIDFSHELAKRQMLKVIRNLQWPHSVIFMLFFLYNTVRAFMAMFSIFANSNGSSELLRLAELLVLLAITFLFAAFLYCKLYTGLKYNVFTSSYGFNYSSFNEQHSTPALWSAFTGFTIIVGVCIILPHILYLSV